MWIQRGVCLFVLLLTVSAFGQDSKRTVQERLGYPATARLLVIHADDLGMAHSVDKATFEALEKGWVTSASILVPCPWLAEVAHWTQSHPNADLGIHLALNALEAELKKQGKSLDDKGPDGWTYRQRFFLSYAYSWCSNVRPEVARLIVTTNPHSLPIFRIDNVVSNMSEFAQAFGCKTGQKMVRANACRVW